MCTCTCAGCFLAAAVAQRLPITGRDRGPIVRGVALRKPITAAASDKRRCPRRRHEGLRRRGVSVAWKRKRCLLSGLFFYFFFCECDCCQGASGGGTDRGFGPRLVPLELLSVVFWLTSTKEAVSQIRLKTNKQVETCPPGREWNVHMYHPGRQQPDPWIPQRHLRGLHGSDVGANTLRGATLWFPEEAEVNKSSRRMERGFPFFEPGIGWHWPIGVQLPHPTVIIKWPNYGQI